MKPTKYMISSLVAVMLVMLSASSVQAQHTYRFRDSLGSYEVRFTPHDSSTRFTLSRSKPLLQNTHDLRLATSWGGSDRYGTATYYSNNSLSYVHHPDVITTYAPQQWYSIVLDYGYWLKEWLEVGAAATYLIGVQNIYNEKNDAKLLTLHRHYISVMPMVRMAWFRRGMVQLYSSLALGVGVDIRERYNEGAFKRSGMITDIYCAYDVKYVGIAVGRRWIGFAELGHGARGIFTVGFGRRFNGNVE